MTLPDALNWSIDALEALTPYTRETFSAAAEACPEDTPLLASLKDRNTPGPARVAELTGALEACAAALAVDAVHERMQLTGDMLAGWLEVLQVKIAGLSSTDYVLGVADGSLLVEDGGQVLPRKGELTALLARIVVTEAAFDWGALDPAERRRVAGLLFTMGAGCRIEEYNRFADLDRLNAWLAEKLAVLEANHGKELFRAGAILDELASYPRLERELLAGGHVTRILFAEHRHRQAFLAQTSPCTDRLARIGALLDIDPALLDADDALRQRGFSRLFEREPSIHHLMGRIACHARRDLADQVVIITKQALGPLAAGDIVSGVAALLDGVFHYDALAGIENDPRGPLVLLRPHRRPVRLFDDTLEPAEFERSWRVTLADLDGIEHPRIRQIRLGAYYRTRGEPHEGAFDDSQVCNPLFNRLVIYNLNKKLRGRQRLVIDPVFAAHLSFAHVDARGERVLLNPGHAIAGTQFGLMMPLVYGDYEGLTEVRFYRERRDMQHAYQLDDLPGALAYTRWIASLMTAYLGWDRARADDRARVADAEPA